MLISGLLMAMSGVCVWCFPVCFAYTTAHRTKVVVCWWWWVVCCVLCAFVHSLKYPTYTNIVCDHGIDETCVVVCTQVLCTCLPSLFFFSFTHFLIITKTQNRFNDDDDGYRNLFTHHNPNSSSSSSYRNNLLSTYIIIFYIQQCEESTSKP